MGSSRWIVIYACTIREIDLSHARYASSGRKRVTPSLGGRSSADICRVLLGGVLEWIICRDEVCQNGEAEAVIALSWVLSLMRGLVSCPAKLKKASKHRRNFHAAPVLEPGEEREETQKGLSLREYILIEMLIK